MRSAGNFNPEWGYLAPAPSFMRTVRVVLVATAIGATAGAAVVISLIDRPAGEGDRTASVARHAIVTSAQAAPATVVPAVAAAPVAAQIKETTAAPSSAAVSSTLPQATPPSALQSVTPAAADVGGSALPAATVAAPSRAVAPSQVSITTAAPGKYAPNDAAAVEPKHSTGMAALSEASPAGETAHAAEESDQSLLPPEPVPDDKKAKHHLASAAATTGKNKPAPSLGSVLRRIFNQPAGRSYYPNH